MTPSVGETSKERRKMETKNKREEMRGKLGECERVTENMNEKERERD